MDQHTCKLCAEEAIPERCPGYCDPGAWTDSDADCPTNPEDDFAWVTPLEARMMLLTAALVTTR